MKKVTYLLLLMFATVLLTTSCEEDELITPIITLEEFVGYWNFISCDYNEEDYSACLEISGTDLDWIKQCMERETETYPFTFNEKLNEFNVGSGIIFKILEYDKTDKILTAKLFESQDDNNFPIFGTIYTWQKKE